MKLKDAIDSIWECRQRGIYYPSEWRGKLDVAQGYGVQLGILAKALKGGARHTGWKVGLTAKAIQEQIDFHERVFGFLLESGELASGAKVPYADLVAPSFEVELLAVLSKDLAGPDVTPEQAREAIGSVAPSLELVEKRGDFAADAPLSMADNVQQRGYVVGPLTHGLPPELRLDATTVEAFINGERMERASGEAVMGGPEASVAWLANRLSDFGRRLEAGTKVLTGSVTRQFPIAQGDVVEARFAPFGVVTVEFV